MLKITQGEWFSVHGLWLHNLAHREKVHLEVSCVRPVTVSVIDHDGDEIVIRTGEFINEVFLFEGWASLQIKTEAKYAAGVKTFHNVLQVDEPRHNTPVPLPGERGMHILQKIRLEARRNAGLMREAFAIPDTDLPGYELDDDEDALFEEEELQLLRQDEPEPEPEPAPADKETPADE